MPGRIRNTKKLAQRIERDYFKKIYPLALWRWGLTWGFLLIGLAWLGWSAINGSGRPYSAGPLARVHQSFERKCDSCHVASAGFSTANSVTDRACSSCHDGALHQARQTFAPACASCHPDHRGTAAQLTAVNERACTQCHAALRTRDGTPAVAAAIVSLANGHPQIGVLRRADQDRATLKFNHAAHLKKELRGLRNAVQLTCSDCHRPAGLSDPWPYALPAPVPNPRTSPSPSYRGSYRAMQPIRYELQCAGCHPLTFDPEIPDAARHGTPEMVAGVVQAKLFEYIAHHPEIVLRMPRLFDPTIPRRPRMRPASNAADWVNWRLADAELLLWKKTCPECHTLDFKAGTPLPAVQPVEVPERWLKNAEFSHSAHRMESCVSCHRKASTSQLTSDVLLPGIERCQSCHRGGAGAAESRCSECHIYHDPRQRKLTPPR